MFTLTSCQHLHQLGFSPRLILLLSKEASPAELFSLQKSLERNQSHGPSRREKKSLMLLDVCIKKLSKEPLDMLLSKSVTVDLENLKDGTINELTLTIPSNNHSKLEKMITSFASEPVSALTMESVKSKPATSQEQFVLSIKLKLKDQNCSEEDTQPLHE